MLNRRQFSLSSLASAVAAVIPWCATPRFKPNRTVDAAGRVTNEWAGTENFQGNTFFELTDQEIFELTTGRLSWPGDNNCNVDTALCGPVTFSSYDSTIGDRDV